MQEKILLKVISNHGLIKTSNHLKAICSDGVIYSECYGSEYHGLPQILKWFSDRNYKWF